MRNSHRIIRVTVGTDCSNWGFVVAWIVFPERFKEVPIVLDSELFDKYVNDFKKDKAQRELSEEDYIGQRVPYYYATSQDGEWE